MGPGSGNSCFPTHRKRDFWVLVCESWEGKKHGHLHWAWVDQLLKELPAVKGSGVYRNPRRFTICEPTVISKVSVIEPGRTVSSTVLATRNLCWLSPVFLMPTHCLMMSAGVLGLQGMQEWDLWKTESVCRNVLNQKDVLQKLALNILARKLNFFQSLGGCFYEFSLQVAHSYPGCLQMLLWNASEGM